MDNFIINLIKEERKYIAFQSSDLLAKLFLRVTESVMRFQVILMIL